MYEVRLVNSKNGDPLCALPGRDGCHILVVEPYGAINGACNSATRTTAGTTIITEPRLNESITLTDLIVTSDRVALASFLVRFYDGTNEFKVMSADINDAPCNLALPLRGNWNGWKNARLELVTVGTGTITVSCGYFKVGEDNTMSYSTWLAER